MPVIEANSWIIASAAISNGAAADVAAGVGAAECDLGQTACVLERLEPAQREPVDRRTGDVAGDEPLGETPVNRRSSGRSGPGTAIGAQRSNAAVNPTSNSRVKMFALVQSRPSPLRRR